MGETLQRSATIWLLGTRPKRLCAEAWYPARRDRFAVTTDAQLGLKPRIRGPPRYSSHNTFGCRSTDGLSRRNPTRPVGHKSSTRSTHSSRSHGTVVVRNTQKVTFPWLKPRKWVTIKCGHSTFFWSLSGCEIPVEVFLVYLYNARPRYVGTCHRVLIVLGTAPTLA